MIAAYAQSSQRQGLDSAVDGEVVKDVNPEFIKLRERGKSLAASNPIQVGAVELRYSRGLCRFVFDDTAEGQDGSPITVVIDMNALQGDVDLAAATALESVHAIHRQGNAEGLRTAINVATEIHASYLIRRRIVITGSVVVVAGIVVAAAMLIANALPRQ